jgi:hypothetical protein
MQKRQTLLERIGQEMAGRMSPTERAHAKRTWEAMFPATTEEIGTPLIRSTSWQPPQKALIKLEPGGGKTRVFVDSLLLYYQLEKQKPPAAAEFLLFMLSRERREDVFADLVDWYPSWCGKFGTRRAKFLCWWRVACCVGGAAMEVVGQVGEIIGKVIAIK